MVKSLPLRVAACVALALAIAGTTRAQSTTDAADIAAITAFNTRYLKAINDGDIATLSGLTDDDHIMVAPGRPPIVGKAANDAANGRGFQTFNFKESWAPIETVVDGNLAYQRGTFTVIATPKAGGVTRTTTGNFLRIYRRQPDGSWRMSRDTFNSDQQPAAPNASGAAQPCDRACLEGFVDRYLDAVLAHQPANVPLAPGVRFTEDGQELRIGDGLWRTLRAKGKYRLFVSDVPAGEVVFFGTIEEDGRDPGQGTPALIGLRLHVKDGQLTQIEQLVIRDEKAAARVAALTPNPIFTQAIPPAQRMSRADLIATANKYFSGMQQNDGKGDYPFADDCNRLENGMQTTNAPTPAGQTRPDPKTSLTYSVQWGCMEQFRSGLLHFVTRIRDRRFVAVDTERGLAVAFGFFDHSGGTTRTFQTPDGRSVTSGPVQPWTWEMAEMFRIENGKIHKIEAVLQRSPYGMNSGWSTWTQGMSDQARDVTME